MGCNIIHHPVKHGCPKGRIFQQHLFHKGRIDHSLQLFHPGGFPTAVNSRICTFCQIFSKPLVIRLSSGQILPVGQRKYKQRLYASWQQFFQRRRKHAPPGSGQVNIHMTMQKQPVNHLFKMRKFFHLIQNKQGFFLSFHTGNNSFVYRLRISGNRRIIKGNDQNSGFRESPANHTKGKIRQNGCLPATPGPIEDFHIRRTPVVKQFFI